MVNQNANQRLHYHHYPYCPRCWRLEEPQGGEGHLINFAWPPTNYSPKNGGHRQLLRLRPLRPPLYKKSISTISSKMEPKIYSSFETYPSTAAAFGSLGLKLGISDRKNIPRTLGSSRFGLEFPDLE